jgi:HAD superfamily hydrolase (TIGR01509 family)
VEGGELAALVEERIERYLALAEDGETVSRAVREAVAYAAGRVRVAVVSGAFRREIEPVLAGAELDRHVAVIVAADDVGRGKPDPEGYLRALALLDGGLLPLEVVAFEDTEAGVASAKAAGLRCVAIVGTHPAERLRKADELVEAINAGLVRRLLG